LQDVMQVQQMQSQMMEAQQAQAMQSQKFDPEAAQMQTELDITKQQSQIEAKKNADIEKMRVRSQLMQENDAAKGIVELSKDKLKNQMMPTSQQGVGNR